MYTINVASLCEQLIFFAFTSSWAGYLQVSKIWSINQVLLYMYTVFKKDFPLFN